MKGKIEDNSGKDKKETITKEERPCKLSDRDCYIITT